MGFLEALGKAKPADDILGAVGKYANIQQTNASTENIKATTALNAENLEMARIKRNQEQYQLKKQQEQEDFDNQVMPIDSHPFYKNIASIAPNTYSKVLELSEGLGLVSPLPGSNQKVISNKNFNMLQQHLTKNPQEMQTLMGSGIDEITEQMAKLEEESKQIPQDKNGQAALAQIQQQWNRLNNIKLRFTNDATALEKHITQEKIDTENKMVLEAEKQKTALATYGAKQKIKNQVNPPKSTTEYKDLAIDMKTIAEFNKKEATLNKNAFATQKQKDDLEEEKSRLQPVFERVAQKLGTNTGTETKPVTSKTATSQTKPVISKSKTGKPIVSYDGGKTWEYKK